jgi:hypothetical protein
MNQGHLSLSLSLSPGQRQMTSIKPEDGRAASGTITCVEPEEGRAGPHLKSQFPSKDVEEQLVVQDAFQNVCLVVDLAHVHLNRDKRRYVGLHEVPWTQAHPKPARGDDASDSKAWASLARTQ